jgi:hypothetical protein
MIFSGLGKFGIELNLGQTARDPLLIGCGKEILLCDQRGFSGLSLDLGR